MPATTFASRTEGERRQYFWQDPDFCTRSYGSPEVSEFSMRCEESTLVQLPAAAGGKLGLGSCFSAPAASRLRHKAANSAGIR
jgi:hypothetical protein